jgi:hypothetical protein
MRPSRAKFRVQWEKKARQCGVQVQHSEIKLALPLASLSQHCVCVDVPTMLAFSCSLPVPYGPDDGCPCPPCLVPPPAARKGCRAPSNFPSYTVRSAPFPLPPPGPGRASTSTGRHRCSLSVSRRRRDALLPRHLLFAISTGAQLCPPPPMPGARRPHGRRTPGAPGRARRRGVPVRE